MAEKNLENRLKEIEEKINDILFMLFLLSSHYLPSDLRKIVKTLYATHLPVEFLKDLQSDTDNPESQGVTQ